MLNKESMNKQVKLWQFIIAVIAMPFITGFIFMGFDRSYASSIRIEEALKTKAEIPYVDSQDKKLQENIDKGFLEHKQIKDELNTRLQRIEDTQAETNKMIIDIWKNMRSKGN